RRPELCAPAFDACCGKRLAIESIETMSLDASTGASTDAPTDGPTDESSIDAMSIDFGSRLLAEARLRRRKLGERREALLGVELLRALVKDFRALHDVGIGDAAIHRANGGAGLLVVEPDTLGAELRVNDEDVLSLRDRGVRALGLARTAVDALLR